MTTIDFGAANFITGAFEERQSQNKFVLHEENNLVDVIFVVIWEFSLAY